MAVTEQLHPMCPRCGYDQSGVVATWETACPVEGVCPECGHGFAWADLFNPSRQDLPWSVEAAAGTFGRLKRTPGMVARMLLPWVYWNRIGVDMAVRPRRLLAWLVMLALGAHVLAWPFVTIAIVLLFRGFWPLDISDLPEVFRDSTPSELLAYAVNGLGWPFVVTSQDWTGWSFGAFANWGSALEYLRALLGFGLTWCVVLMVLPATRRIAKLRRGHVVRAAVLQLAPIPVLFGLIRAGLFAHISSFGTVMHAIIMWTSVAVGLWSICWWASALRSGWGIRSWPLLILGTFAALLGGFVAVYIDDSIWFIFVY